MRKGKARAGLGGRQAEGDEADERTALLSRGGSRFQDWQQPLSSPRRESQDQDKRHKDWDMHSASSAPVIPGHAPSTSQPNHHHHAPHPDCSQNGHHRHSHHLVRTSRDLVLSGRSSTEGRTRHGSSENSRRYLSTPARPPSPSGRTGHAEASSAKSTAGSGYHSPPSLFPVPHAGQSDVEVFRDLPAEREARRSVGGQQGEGLEEEEFEERQEAHLQALEIGLAPVTAATASAPAIANATGMKGALVEAGSPKERMGQLETVEGLSMPDGMLEAPGGRTSASDTGDSGRRVTERELEEGGKPPPPPPPPRRRFPFSLFPPFNFRGALGYLQLFRYSSKADYLLTILGFFAAVAAGVPLPLIGVLFGELIDGFNDASCSTSLPGQDTPHSLPPDKREAFQAAVNDKVLKIVYVAMANFVLIWIYTACWSTVGERLVRRLRERYVEALMRQDQGYFDTLGPGTVANRLGPDIQTIQAGTSEKVGILISSVSYFIVSYIVAFIKLPLLAAELTSLLPAFFLVSMIGSHFVSKYTASNSAHLSNAISLAAEALSNLSVVQAFGMQEKLAKLYDEHLRKARREGVKKAMAAAMMLGCLFFVGYSANSLAFFEGSRSIIDAARGRNKSQSVGNVYTVIFLLLDASFIIGQIAPYLQTFSAASGAGRSILATIARQSSIDGTDLSTGLTPILPLLPAPTAASTAAAPAQNVTLGFRLQDLSFAYPSRRNVLALDGVDLEIEPGKRTGICGISGSGKSTVVALVQRFYDPIAGSLKLTVGHGGQQGVDTKDVADVKDLNLRWLRSQIGIVGQEPVLFDCTILQSIAHGLINSSQHEHLRSTLLSLGSPSRSDCSTGSSNSRAERAAEDRHLVRQREEHVAEIRALVERAAKLADAHKFIESLPKGYDTLVGEEGGRISGGQKQRIALARAIVKDPRILILDEATAALDSQSEAAIQRAFDTVSEGRTTLAIAHRLSTLKYYDKIIVLAHGRVMEQGTHAELIALRGHYYNLAQAQNAIAPEERETKKTDTGLVTQKMEEETGNSAPSTEEESVSKFDPNADDGWGSPPPEYDETCSVCEDGHEHRRSYSTSAILHRIAGMTRPEWIYVMIGLGTSAIIGGAFSGEAVIFGHVIDALNPCKGLDRVRTSADFFALMFFLLALVELFSYTVNGSAFGYTSERLLFRVRGLSFRSLCHQRLAWFDKHEQTPSTMISSLSSDANHLGGLTGTVIGTMFAIFVNLVAGITLAHVIAWKIAIVILSTVPILLASGYMRLKVLADFQRRHEVAYVKSTAIATEAISSIRTVASLGREDDVSRLFRESLERPYKESLRHIIYGNVWLASALSVSYFIYSFAYWWGSKQVSEGNYTQVDFFTVLPALLFSAQASGQLLAFAPDFSKAHVSAGNVFRLIDQDPRSRRGRDGDGEEEGQEGGGKPESDLKAPNEHGSLPGNGYGAAVNGQAVVNSVQVVTSAPSRVHRIGEEQGGTKVEFKGVCFAYPTRRDSPALRKLSLEVPPSSFCAFIGPSGSGKSTTVALIEKFYDPQSGTILIDDKNISTVDEDELREDMAIVPQEPVLFYGSIRFNVALGARPRRSYIGRKDYGGDAGGAALSGRGGKRSDRRRRTGRKNGREGENNAMEDGGENASVDGDEAPHDHSRGVGEGELVDVSQEEIEEACKLANIHDTIVRLPEGYDTLCGNKGSLLSGGQRQRLAIARALLRKPRLLLLDESTSALDAESERAFQASLDQICSRTKCTVIAVAHRMSTIRRADRIFLFEHGAVVESGPHQRLLEKSPRYRAMVEHQNLAE